MKIEVHKFEALTRSQLKRLYPLTNDASRGDVRDTGGGAGSHFRNVLDDRMCDGSYPNTWVVIVSEGNRYVAWCMVKRHDRDPINGRPFNVPTASVGFYVDPDFRRLGLGTRLIQAASEVARKNGMGRLLANPWNKSSNAFFQSCGFVDLTPYVPGWCKGTCVLELDEEACVSAAE